MKTNQSLQLFRKEAIVLLLFALFFTHGFAQEIKEITEPIYRVILVSPTKPTTMDCGGNSINVQIRIQGVVYTNIPQTQAGVDQVEDLIWGNIKGNPGNYGLNCAGCQDPKQTGCDMKFPDANPVDIQIADLPPSLNGITIPPFDLTIDGVSCTFCKDTTGPDTVNVDTASTQLRTIPNSDPSLNGSASSLHSEDLIAVNLYPNPAKEALTADFRIVEDNSNISVRIFDSSGRLVMSKKMGAYAIGEHSFSIDLPQLTSGSYFTQIFNNDQLSSSHRLIIIE